jgi:hypothetical protein
MASPLKLQSLAWISLSYASAQRLGCFIETLARFRVDVSFLADLALMENGEDDFTALGTVRRAWIKGRCIGTANVEGE